MKTYKEGPASACDTHRTLTTSPDKEANVAETYFNVCHPPDERIQSHTTASQLFQGREWLDLRALTQYASVSERTMREWIHRPANPLPAVRVGAKILVRRSEFDRWLEKHRLEPIDIGSVVSEVVSDLIGANS